MTDTAHFIITEGGRPVRIAQPGTSLRELILHLNTAGYSLARLGISMVLEDNSCEEVTEKFWEDWRRDLRMPTPALRSEVVRRARNGFSLEEHLGRQREFSFMTFGPPQRKHGVVDHIRKELVEIEQDPTDLMEWIDVVILAFDGALRAGHSPADIVNALEQKQSINESREWPDWRTAEPGKAIEHVRG